MEVAGIQHRVENFLAMPEVKEALADLRQRLPESASIYLVGGAIRNLAIEAVHGYRPEIKDLDLFIDPVKGDLVLWESFPPSRIEKTDLGGLRWRPSGCGYDFDLCLLKDFVIFEKLKLPPTLSHLLDSLDFTMNTFVYDLKRRLLHQRSALADIRRRLLEFNTRVFYTRLATCYRCLLLRYKTGFFFSESVFGFLHREVDLDTLIETRRLLWRRQGRALAEEILADYDRISTSRNYADYLGKQ